jgi:hypothetical protein
VAGRTEQCARSWLKIKKASLRTPFVYQIKLDVLFEIIKPRLINRIGAGDQIVSQAREGGGLHTAIGQLKVSGTLMQITLCPSPSVLR